MYSFAWSRACPAGAAARTALAARVGDAVRRAEAGDGRAGERAGAVRRVAECIEGARLHPSQVHVSRGRASALAYAVLSAACEHAHDWLSGDCLATDYVQRLYRVGVQERMQASFELGHESKEE